MSTVFLIHGSDGYPEENWFPWLRSKLEKDGREIIVPQFPTADGHVLSRWFETFRQYQDRLNEQSIMIGHSRGCAFIWRVLESLQHPVLGAFFVGGFSQYLWYPKENNAVDSFYEKPFDWEKILSNMKHVTVYQSDNDPYVPVEIGKEVANNFHVPLTLVHDAGHFNTPAGYTTFPLLLKDVKSVLGTLKK